MHPKRWFDQFYALFYVGLKHAAHTHVYRESVYRAMEQMSSIALQTLSNSGNGLRFLLCHVSSFAPYSANPQI